MPATKKPDEDDDFLEVEEELATEGDKKKGGPPSNDNEPPPEGDEPDEGDEEGSESPDRGKGKPQDGDKPKRTVPLATLKREQERWKASQDELRRERMANAERNARLEERLTILNQALQPPPQAPPDPDQDIFAAFNHLQGQFSTLQQQTAQDHERRRFEAQQAQQVQQLMSAYQADAMRYRAEDPSFNDAYGYLIQHRMQELNDLGYDPQTVQQTVRNDEMRIAAHAFQSGQSPAEMIVRLARSRGFAGAAANDNKGNGKGNGAAEIARLQRGKSASQTLNGVGGGAGGQKITLESIDRMSQKEFENLVRSKNKNGPGGFDEFVRRLELSKS